MSGQSVAGYATELRLRGHAVLPAPRGVELEEGTLNVRGHVMDDVKDRLADRRPDLSYLLMHEEAIGLPDWLAGLQAAMDACSATHPRQTG